MITVFSSDEGLLDTLRRVAPEFMAEVRAVPPEDIRAAPAEAIFTDAVLLVADLSGRASPLDDVRAVLTARRPDQPLLVVGNVNDMKLYRNIIECGASDYLLKPVSRDDLYKAITRAIRCDAAAGARSARSIAVIGARGGVGCSTLAVSLAWLISEIYMQRTALFDLDLFFGMCALAFDLEPGRGLTDAIKRPDRIEPSLIESTMVSAGRRLWVLAAEAPLTLAQPAHQTVLLSLHEALTANFACTVIDLPRNTLLQHPDLAGAVQSVVLVAERTLAAARDTIRLLSLLKVNARDAEVTVVVADRGMTSGEGEISINDFEASIERKIDFVYRFDPSIAVVANRLGRPFAEVALDLGDVTMLADLTERLLGIGPDDQAMQTGGVLDRAKSGWSKIEHFLRR